MADHAPSVRLPGVASLPAARLAGDAMPDALNAAELLDVDVDELTGLLALIAVGRLERLQPAAFPQPDTQQHR